MGFGKWLKKRFKIKPLNTYLDDIGTIGGFAIGGPLGAGIGRAIGHTAEEGGKVNIGSLLKAGVTGYGAGSLGNFAGSKLGLLGERAAAGAAAAPALETGASDAFTEAVASGVGGSPASVGWSGGPGMNLGPLERAASAARAAPPTPPGGGGSWIGNAAKSAGKFVSKPEGMMAASMGLNTLGNMYGSYKQGQYLDFERERELEREKRIRDFLQNSGMLDRLTNLLGERFEKAGV